MAKTISPEDALTDEGKAMFRSISKLEKMLRMEVEQEPEAPKPAPIEISAFEVELFFVKKELARMIKNSEMVIADCDTIIVKIKTKEEYIKSDAKIARAIHKSLTVRLQRILDGFSAFEHEVKLDDE